MLLLLVHLLLPQLCQAIVFNPHRDDRPLELQPANDHVFVAITPAGIPAAGPRFPQGPQPFGNIFGNNFNKVTTTTEEPGPFPGAPFPAPPPPGINGGQIDYAPEPPNPGFLNHVSDRARREYSRIINNDTQTRNQLKAEIFDWASRQGEHILQEVVDYEKNETSRREEIKTNITALLTSLPLAYEKYVTIKENEELSKADEREQIRAFFEFLDDDVARVLQYITFSMGRPRPSHPDPLEPQPSKPVNPINPGNPWGQIIAPGGGQISIGPDGRLIIGGGNGNGNNGNNGNGGNGNGNGNGNGPFPTIIWPSNMKNIVRPRFF